jgi:hypothetical protein
MWYVKYDNEEQRRGSKPIIENPRPSTSPFTYNTPAYSLLKEAEPISTRISKGKVGNFSRGMSMPKLSKKKENRNSATALRDECNILTGSKPDMFVSSGGVFGKVPKSSWDNTNIELNYEDEDMQQSKRFMT